MTSEMAFGYAVGIVTMAALAMFRENLKPTITENPLIYMIVGVALAAFCVLSDFLRF